MPAPSSPPPAPSLARPVGAAGAVLLGLGSMVGTGVFVSLGIAAGVAGPSLLAAVLVAGALAAANGLSSAQLAAAHPVSGGTYEYGHRWLGPAYGFSAGWMFLWAKSASAATAALGLAGYLAEFVPTLGGSRAPGAAGALTLLLTAFVAGGMRRSNRGNALLVAGTLVGLLALVALAAPRVMAAGPELLVHRGAETRGLGPLLHGSALVFVAFTGYGRIATLGEEVRDPRRVIPRAIGITVVAVTLLYLAVAAVGLGVLGAGGFADATTRTAAPLEAVARALGVPGLRWVVAAAAVTAMAGVLLNLVLGLSRVVLAMGRRGEAPAILARIDPVRRSPVAAVWACGLVVAALTLVGDVRLTWSFSAFTVLVYYALTNAAALRLDPADRLFPRWVSVAGLVGCLGLGVQVDPKAWGGGLALLAVGLGIHALARRLRHG